MIKLSGEIELIQNNVGSLSTASSNIPKNNISVSINDVLGTEKAGTSAFIMGASSIKDFRTLESRAECYIGSELSNVDGVYSKPYIFTIQGTDITALTIVFDRVNNQYATNITINGVDYTNDMAIFVVNDLPKTNELTIKITKWNTPKYPVIIQGIYANIKINVNDSNMLNISSRFMKKSNIDKPSFGIISNSGKIEFIDDDDFVLSLINRNLISNAKVKIYLEDTVSQKKQLVGQLITKKWNYDNNNKEVNIDLQDDLVEWQDILVDEIPLLNKGITARDIVNDYLLVNTPSSFNIVITEVAQQLLDNIKLKYFYLEKDNLWNEWQKLCDLGFVIYKNFDNQVILDSALLPNSSNLQYETSKVIPVKSGAIFELNDDKIIDNQITGIEYSENQTGYIKHENEVVADYNIDLDRWFIEKVGDEATDTQGNDRVRLEITYWKGNAYIEENHIWGSYLEKILDLDKVNDYDYLVEGKKTIIQSPSGDLAVDYFLGKIETFKASNGSASVELTNQINVTITQIEDSPKRYRVSFKIPVSYKLTKDNLADGSSSSEFILVDKLNLKIYGNIYKFEAKPKKITIGEQINYSLSSNELMQDNTLMQDLSTSSTSNIPIGKALSNLILKGNFNYNTPQINLNSCYGKGKEIIEILCQIGEYDDNPQNIISTKIKDTNMVFRIDNIVKPFIYKNGGDVPICIGNELKSLFEILGVEIFYDGAVWQRIFVQSIFR